MIADGAVKPGDTRVTADTASIRLQLRYGNSIIIVFLDY